MHRMLFAVFLAAASIRRARPGAGQLPEQADQDRAAGAGRQRPGHRGPRDRRAAGKPLGPAGADRGAAGRRRPDRRAGRRQLRRPDGYTLLGGPSSLFTILPAQKDKLPIDVNRDFTQLGMMVGSGVMFIAVSPKLGVSNWTEFAALAKSKPGQIAIGTNGAGTLPHFAGLGDREEGQRADHRGALQPGWHHGSRGRHHGRARARHDRSRVRAARPAAIGRPQVDRPDGSRSREPEFPNVPTIGISAIGFMTWPRQAPRRRPSSVAWPKAFVRRWTHRRSSSATPISACRSATTRRRRPRRSSRTSRRSGGRWCTSSRRRRRGTSATADRAWPRG